MAINFTSWACFSPGRFYDSQGQTLFFPEFNTPANNNGITSDTDYESYTHILATLTFHGFTLQGLFSTREKGVPTAYFGAVFNDPADFNIDSHQFLNLGYQHSIGKWQLDAHTSYDQARLQGPVPEAPLMPGDPVVLNTFSFRGNWWTGEVKVSRDLFERNHLTLGTEVRDNFRQDQGDLLNPPNVFTPEPNSSLITAFYAQDEFAITSRLTLNAGVRYDHYSTFGGTTNPRLALIYRPADKTTLKLLYGKAFSAPDVYQTSPNFGIFYDDNLNLRPERIQSLEARVEQGLGQYFQLSGGVYRNRINDLISLVSVPGDRNFQYQNDGNAQATGMDVELSGRAANGLQGKASFDYVDAYNDSAGHPALDNSPRHMAKLDVMFPWSAMVVCGSRRAILGKTLDTSAEFTGQLSGVQPHAAGTHGRKTPGRGGQRLQCSGQEILRSRPPGRSGKRNSTGWKKLADQDHWPVLKNKPKQTMSTRDGVPVNAGLQKRLRLGLCLLLLSGSGFGEEQDLTQLSLEDLMNTKVTSVSKKEQKMSQVAAAIFVITQEDIQRSGATNLPDLLRMVPGLDVAQINANSWANRRVGLIISFRTNCWS